MDRNGSRVYKVCGNKKRVNEVKSGCSWDAADNLERNTNCAREDKDKDNS